MEDHANTKAAAINTALSTATQAMGKVGLIDANQAKLTSTEAAASSKAYRDLYESTQATDLNPPPPPPVPPEAGGGGTGNPTKPSDL